MTLMPLSGLRGIAYRSKYSLRVLRGNCKQTDVVWARWRCYTEAYSAGFSLHQIGRFFKRDHTTILYGIRRYMGQPAWHLVKPGERLSLELLMERRQDENLNVLHEQLAQEALRLWDTRKYSTLRIADQLSVTEDAVYNTLSNMKGQRHAAARIGRNVGDNVDRRDGGDAESDARGGTQL